MSRSQAGWSPQVATFIHKVGTRENPHLKALRKETDSMADGGMRSSIEQGQLLAWLIEFASIETIVEVGCFTGYGTLAMALALPSHGRITTLDVNDDWVGIGRRYWREAGVEPKIEFISGLALETLEVLLADKTRTAADMIYIDADKKSYDLYYECALRLVRQGGVIALDNMLWGGAVADLNDQSRQASSLRDLNRKIHDDERVSPVMVPIADGLVLARKR